LLIAHTIFQFQQLLSPFWLEILHPIPATLHIPRVFSWTKKLRIDNKDSHDGDKTLATANVGLGDHEELIELGLWYITRITGMRRPKA
jgi:hypothetical protein